LGDERRNFMATFLLFLDPVPFGIWALLGFLILLGWGMMAYALHERKDALSWPTAGGRVVRSSVNTKQDVETQENLYWPQIVYEYWVNGKSHVSDVLEFGDPNRDEKQSEEVVQQYPPGASVIAYYNPQRPAEASLKPGKLNGNVLICGCMILLYAIGNVVCLLSGWRPK
jgi:hypothetical protein